MSVYSSKIVKNMFGTEEMRNIFSDESKVSNFIKIEIALAKVEAELEIIPMKAYEDLNMRSKEFEIDWDRFRRDVESLGYPVLPFLKQFSEFCGKSGEYLHWGSTTRDITDTSLALQIQDALSVFLNELLRVKTLLTKMTSKYSKVLTISRTHGMHALPTTFGFRTAIWLVEVNRQIERVQRVKDNVNIGQFGGAVGTLAALGNRGVEVQTALMKELNLRAPVISWFASRDNISEVVFTIASVAQTMASMAKTIVIMTRDELKEARESFPSGRGTSSAMPHKRNTVSSELVLVHGKMASSFVSTVMEAMVQDFDRDWQGHFETIVVPQAFLHAHSAVREMCEILEHLEIFPDQMRQNLDLTRGLIMAESVMMRLANLIGRDKAHTLVTDLCSSAINNNCHLYDVLIANHEVREYLSIEEISDLINPENYLGSVEEIIDMVLEESDN